MTANDLPEPLSERIRVVRQRPLRSDGAFVLYWTHHAVRADENPALDAAVAVGNEIGRPVLVYQGLGGRHRFNNDRHHTFIMQGAADLQRDLAERGIACGFHLGRDPREPSPLGDLLNHACLLITEDFPAPPFPIWLARVAERSPVPVWAVDTSCIVPMQSIEKCYTRAFQFRKRTADEFADRLRRPWPEMCATVAPYRGPLPFASLDLREADIAALCAACAIDHGVAPVPHTIGGGSAGYARWDAFVADGLRGYARLRNDAAVEPPRGVSRMSAYLHHGHVSPFRIAREAAAVGGTGAEKFLDELLIWRELSHNFCFHRRTLETLDALPEWARKTLLEHAGDPRPRIYSWEQLARGATDDELWNAAQHSLVRHGELHNNLRMTWGKTLIQWAQSPADALALLIDLNHRYALDGNDPNSYGGLLWCLGQFDRPFAPDRPILGSVRPRSTAGHAARLDVEAYLARINAPAGQRLQVAVIGAGLAGLAAGRTLRDAGHAVTVFDKGRGVGGRMSRRRAEPFAFDHGAQFFRARDENFRRFVDSWRRQGIVANWSARFAEIDGARIAPPNDAERFVATPGMHALAKHVAADLDVLTGVRISGMRRDADGWHLLAGDERIGAFDAVVVAIPAGQAADLLAGVGDDLTRAIESVTMAPCWAVMLGFDEALDVPFDAATIRGHDLAWVARDTSKPDRAGAESWILHATPTWTRAHLDDDPQQVADALQRALAALPGMRDLPEATHRAAHRWRYALAETPLERAEACLWDAAQGVAVCGDWCCGANVESAWRSGIAAAGRVLGSATAVRGSLVD